MKRNIAAIVPFFFCLVFFWLQSQQALPAYSIDAKRYKAILKTIGEGEFERAITELRQIIERNPDFSRAYRNLVDVYMFTDGLEQAQTFFALLLKQNPQNAYAYYALAQIDLTRGELDQSIEKLKKSIELDPDFADAYSHYGGLPEAYSAAGDLDAGIQFFEQLIANHPENACAHYGLARCYIRKYDWEKAMQALQKALVRDPDLTYIYHSMIIVYFYTNRYDKILETSDQLVEVAKKKNDFEMEAYATMMLGNTYFLQGDYGKALSYLQMALTTAQEIGAKNREGVCLNNLANVYAMSADFDKALDYYYRSLQLKRQMGDQLREVRTLLNIANVLKDQTKYDPALEQYKQALNIARENDFKSEESLTLTNMAEIYEKRAEYGQAAILQKNALQIAKDIGDTSLQGVILANLGRGSRESGNLKAAFDYYRRSLAIGTEVRDIQIMWEAHAGLATISQSQGNSDKAISHYARAIALYDSVRENLDLQSISSDFLGDKYQAYPSIVQLMAHSGAYDKAFSYAEKYKAKSILDVISQGNLRVFDRVLPDSVATRLEQVREQLQEFHTELSNEKSSQSPDSDRVLAVDQQITELELERNKIIDRMRIEHSNYLELASPQLVELQNLRDSLLTEGQALVEYIVGPEHLSVFFISKDTLLYSETKIARTELMKKMTALSPMFGMDRPSATGRAEYITHQKTNFTIPPAYALYQLLIQPFAAGLHDIESLIVVPDDVLFYLPFELLITDTSRIETPYDFDNATFLLEKYQVSYIPAASLFNSKVSRQNMGTKSGILAIGNPYFGDETQNKQNLTSVVRGTDLLPLPNSEAEVRGIGQIFSNLDNRILIGRDATETVFKSTADDFSILHLATHFLVNDKQPLYSKIVMAQNDVSEDGFLQTFEVFDMDLNAELVVLSACNSGIGNLRKGEGLIGISRAFLYAGVPSLVVSLWSVNDESTAMIMKNFYRNLKKGLNKSESLRLAKIEYFKSAPDQLKDPFYWAPFVFIGDTAPLLISSQTTSAVWFYIATAVVLFLVIFYFMRRKIIR